MYWTQTISGKKIDLLNLKPEDVDFHDIAHNLANVNRFCGATKRPYSVAEHCVRVHDELAKRGETLPTRLIGLLHDAHEAYMGDIITPVKNALAELAGVHPKYIHDAFDALKWGLDLAIFDAAGLRLTGRYSLPHIKAVLRGSVKDVDAEMMMAERDVLGATPPEPWPGGLEELPRPAFPLYVPGQSPFLDWGDMWLQRLGLYVDLTSCTGQENAA